MARDVAALPKGRLTIEIKSIALICVIILVGFAVIYPVVLLLINSFVVSRPLVEPTRYGLEAWRFAVTDTGMLLAIRNTFLVMIVTQGIAMPVSILIAWLIARTDLPWGRWLEFMFWVAFFLPTISVLQGWILLLHPSAGLLNDLVVKLPFVSQGPFNIFSFWGIIFIHLFTNTIAIKVMLLTPAFRRMDAALEDASRISGANPIRTLIRVTVPVLTPAIIVMTMLATVRMLQTVEVELILGTPINFFVFGSKIFSLTTTEPPMFGAATALGLLMLIAVVPLIFLQRWLSVRRRYTTMTGSYRPQVMKLGRWKWPVFAAVLTFGLMVTLVPFVFLLTGTFMKLYGFFDVPGGAFTLRWWESVLTDSVFLRSLRNTLILATVSATGSAIFFFLVAYFIVRNRTRFSAVLDFLAWVPYTLPGIVMVLAWLWIFLQTPFLRPLHGSLIALIIVASLTGMTLAVQILKAALLQLGNEMEEASATVGANWLTTVRRVVIPLMLQTILVVWIINFVAAAGSAIMPALLGSPASRPLATLQLERVISAQYEAASVVGVLVVLMTVGVALIARALGLRVGLGRIA